MSLTLITPPADVPISLAELRIQCRLTSDVGETEDALLAAYARAATSWVEDHTDKQLITATWRYEFDWFPAPPHSAVTLPRGPVQSIVSITFTTDEGVLETIPPELYWLANDKVWPRDPAVPTDMRPGAAITFAAGYGDSWNDIPESIRQAVQMLAAYWFAQREGASIGPDSGPVSDIPFGPKALLMPYRRIW